MAASSLYNLLEKRHPALRDFQCLAVRRTCEQTSQRRNCALFWRKSGTLEVLARFGRTGSSMLAMPVVAVVARGWSAVELAELMLARRGPCGSLRNRSAALV
jgi:hypothetical protein